MKEKELVDFNFSRKEVFEVVGAEGALLEDIDNWRLAFPDVDFMEIDKSFTGEMIDWESKTLSERAFFVAYMRNPHATKVFFSVDVGDLKLFNRIDDAERIWYMWMAGCFSGEELDEKAIRTFLWYVDDSPVAQRYFDDLDSEDVFVSKLKVSMASI